MFYALFLLLFIFTVAAKQSYNATRFLHNLGNLKLFWYFLKIVGNLTKISMKTLHSFSYTYLKFSEPFWFYRYFRDNIIFRNLSVSERAQLGTLALVLISRTPAANMKIVQNEWDGRLNLSVAKMTRVFPSAVVSLYLFLIEL